LVFNEELLPNLTLQPTGRAPSALDGFDFAPARRLLNCVVLPFSPFCDVDGEPREEFIMTLEA
jgi:hypothetical protein